MFKGFFSCFYPLNMFGRAMYSELLKGFFGANQSQSCVVTRWKKLQIRLSNVNSYAVESALYPLETCGENLISDINNVLWVSACKGVFYIKKHFLKTVSGVRRWIYIHSCYGVKGRYFTLLQVVTEGGDLLWRNLLPNSSQE